MAGLSLTLRSPACLAPEAGGEEEAKIRPIPEHVETALAGTGGEIQ